MKTLRITYLTVMGALIIVSMFSLLTLACSDNDTYVSGPTIDTIIVYPHLPPPDCSEYRYWEWDEFCEQRCNGLAKQLTKVRRELKECRDGI